MRNNKKAAQQNLYFSLDHKIEFCMNMAMN
jgi:hypothetical protein